MSIIESKLALFVMWRSVFGVDSLRTLGSQISDFSVWFSLGTRAMTSQNHVGLMTVQKFLSTIHGKLNVILSFTEIQKDQIEGSLVLCIVSSIYTDSDRLQRVNKSTSLHGNQFYIEINLDLVNSRILLVGAESARCRGRGDMKF